MPTEAIFGRMSAVISLCKHYRLRQCASGHIADKCLPFHLLDFETIIEQSDLSCRGRPITHLRTIPIQRFVEARQLGEKIAEEHGAW